MKKELETYINQRIVVDTSSSLIYIGTLDKVTDACAVLIDVDVHEDTDSLTSKEVYVYETRTSGITANRETVHINLQYVVSFSPLEAVKKF